jgi:hypothetical protein
LAYLEATARVKGNGNGKSNSKLRRYVNNNGKGNRRSHSTSLRAGSSTARLRSFAQDDPVWWAIERRFELRSNEPTHAMKPHEWGTRFVRVRAAWVEK